MGTVVPLGAIRGPGIAVVKRTGELIPISHAFIRGEDGGRAQGTCGGCPERGEDGGRAGVPGAMTAKIRGLTAKTRGLATQRPAPVRLPSRRGASTARGAR